MVGPLESKVENFITNSGEGERPQVWELERATDSRSVADLVQFHLTATEYEPWVDEDRIRFDADSGLACVGFQRTIMEIRDELEMLRFEQLPELLLPPLRDKKEHWIGWSALDPVVECYLLVRQAQSLVVNQEFSKRPQIWTVEFAEGERRISLLQRGRDRGDSRGDIEINVGALDTSWLVTDEIRHYVRYRNFGFYTTYGRSEPIHLPP